MKLSQEKLIKIIKEEQKTVERMREMDDPEGEMVQKQAQMALEAAQKISQMVDGVEDLESWVQAKMTLATEYLQTVSDYLEFSGLVSQHIDKQGLSNKE